MNRKEARRIKEILEEELAANGEFDEGRCLKRIFEEFPKARPDEVRRVSEAVQQEIQLESAQEQAESDSRKYIDEHVQDARDMSGEKDMGTGRALRFLARRGHPDAAAYVDELNDPENRRIRDELGAAAEAHPNWRVESPGVILGNPDTTENTPEKLLNWYRRKRAQE